MSKTILVTGASTGIGQEAALRMARKVMASERSPINAKSVSWAHAS